MKMNKLTWLGGAVVVVLLGALLLGTQGGREGAKAAENATAKNAGQPAPQFQLKDLKGSPVSLADFKGQKVYVKFWASWCPICLAGLDELNQLSGQQHDYKVLTIVSPDFNGEQSEAEFVKWFTKRGFDNIPVLLDTGGAWTKQFGVRGYPSSYYIGSDGILVKAVPGHNTNEVIDQTFQSIH
ncbi:TlpA disulfide reductase family protein [Paenibacillus filicis]|uniref:TlpA disulfide reductase family protein n=1 Tax=Paenibacillus filicis TaxID=669464 RepID=A0ABU9DMD8_9BACL